MRRGVEFQTGCPPNSPPTHRLQYVYVNTLCVWGVYPNKMPKTIARTGATNLTNAELLILDMAATMGGCRRMYNHKIFPQQFNYPSHGLNPPDLKKTLDRFECEGLLTGRDFIDRWGNPDRYVGATAKGGRLWETERNPDWSRYLTCLHFCRDDSDRNRVSIYGHSPSVCQAYFDAARNCGVLDYRGGLVRYGIGNRQLIWWRESQTVYLLSAWLESWRCNWDWSHLEMKRCWWYSPDEISKLWGWPPAEPNSNHA